MTEIDNQDMAGPRPVPFLRRNLIRLAGRIARGELTLTFADGSRHVFRGAEPGPQAEVRVLRTRALWRLAFGGDLGFARAYGDGDVDTPDLAAVFRLYVANLHSLERAMQGSRLMQAVARMRHLARANTRRGSRRNIAFHYDLGNEFYRLWLDPTMTYSSAIFPSADTDLRAAQEEKYARIIRELRLGPDDHVLEIGCGWGGFAEQAARTTGCRVTGLTLSREQAAYATERLAQAGLADRTDIRLVDYRDVTGTFTHIVSIEMFEAVGEENWPVYFDALRRLLVPGGQAMVQAITIDESRFDRYRKRADFIQTYIFPGGMLPSFTAFDQGAQRAGLGMAGSFRFGRDYARTLRDWDRAFLAAWPQIARLGFDDRFKRLWHYYLHYCAEGFEAGTIDVVQFHLTRD